MAAVSLLVLAARAEPDLFATYSNRVMRFENGGVLAGWTETVTNISEIEFLVFPRLPGYAEIGWTPVTERNWETYKIRLGNQAERFKIMHINYYPSQKVSWK